MNDTPITVIGNVTADPELRFTPSGAAVANFTVASTPRRFDKQANEFKDGETLFMRCSVWRDQAENVAESIVRGTRVVVTGSLIQRNWEDKETGDKRSVMEMQVDEVAPSLLWATAKVRKAEKGGSRPAPAQDTAWGQQPAQAPQGGGWGQQAQGGGFGGNVDEIPF